MPFQREESKRSSTVKHMGTPNEKRVPLCAEMSGRGAEKTQSDFCYSEMWGGKQEGENNIPLQKKKRKKNIMISTALGGIYNIASVFLKRVEKSQ